MLRNRRKAVHYANIEFLKDANNEYIVKGGYIKKREDNSIDGPVTLILEETTGSADESIKYIIYVKNKFYLLNQIEKSTIK